MKFAILDSFSESDIERRVLCGHELISYTARCEEDLPDEISELDGCLVWHYVNITSKTLDRLKNCKVIVRIGVGYDSVDIVEAGKRGILVCNVPDYGTNDVADHCMALLLAAVRSICKYNETFHSDMDHSWMPQLGGEIHRLTNSRIGIIGMGRIGHAVAVRAKAFGMEVSFYDPYILDGYDKSYQIRRIDSLENLFRENDIVSIHTPLTNETKGMINKRCFSCIEEPIILVNTARGGIVVLDDVYNAMKEGKIRKFAADVLDEEPPTSKNRLIKAIIEKEQMVSDNVIITPHAAFYAVESQIEMREKAAQVLLDLAEGRQIRNCVNRRYCTQLEK